MTLEERKLHAEIANLNAQRRKTLRDNSNQWRLLQLGVQFGSVIVGAIGVFAAFYISVQQAASAELLKWKTVQGSIDIYFDQWHMPGYPNTTPIEYNRLDECPDDITKSPIAPGESMCPTTTAPGSGIICKVTGKIHPVLKEKITIRRFACWQPYGKNVEFLKDADHSISITASINTLDFSTFNAKHPDWPYGNPRLKLEIPDKGISATGFVIYVETWDNSQPWDTGVSWNASGRLAR